MSLFYEDEAITLYNADCREVLPTLSQPDVLITDPPYCEAFHSGARSTKQSQKMIDFEHTSSDTLREVYELASPSRWTVATMSFRHVADHAKKPPKGMRFVRFGVWIKPNGAPQFSGDRPGMGWESIGIYHSEGGRMRWNGGGRSSVFTHGQQHNEGLPAVTKPLSLMHELVSLFSEPCELIVDPFAGAGTTLLAAKNLGRRAIGIEQSEALCELAVSRLAQGVLPLASADGEAREPEGRSPERRVS